MDNKAIEKFIRKQRVAFISPVFPGITDIEAIIERTKVDYFYHEEVRGTKNSGKRNK